MRPVAPGRRRRQRGVTLLELILAVTLFALITVSSGIVLRVAFTSMNVIDNKVDLDRRVWGAQRALDQILRGMIAVNTPCAGLPVGFQATATSMRFVSGYSLAEGSRGRPQIVELIAEPKTDGSSFRLVINEYPYLGRTSLSAACGQLPQVRATSFIVADQLAECRFFFAYQDPGTGTMAWVPAWTFADWPRGIRIEMQPKDRSANRVQAATFSVPILVRNRQIE